MCRKQPGIAVGRLCEKCDGKCVICDSYVRPHVQVKLCDECNYGSFQGRCVVCGGPGVSDAHYCKECVQQEKDVSRVEREGRARGIGNGAQARGACARPARGKETFMGCAPRPRGTPPRHPKQGPR
jgi:hypothetical protein